MRWLPAWLLACSGPADGATGDPLPVDGLVIVASVPGADEPMELALREGRIVAAEAGMTRQALTDRWVVPGFIDAHVHLAYDPRGAELVAGGVVGAVDWAAPLDRMTSPGGPTVVWSGPMVTAEGGYPLNSWGSDGYGIAVDSAEAARAAVDQLHGAGVGVIKIPIGAGGADLSDAVLQATIDRAHELDLKVGAHALSDANAARAARLGADILVHAPNQTLSDATVELWKGRAVIPTTSAFGGADSTRQLAEAGATILYGTDFGNTRRAGISLAEIEGMVRAGLTPAQILEAGTSAPAAAFGMDDLGSLEIGKESSFLVLDADPIQDPTVLARPTAVVFKGVVVSGGL